VLVRVQARKHATMVVRPSGSHDRGGVASVELRKSHRGVRARVQIGARKVLLEGTRRTVPIGTSSSSFLQSIAPVS